MTDDKIDIQELPPWWDKRIYMEPSFDEPVDDGSRSLQSEPIETEGTWEKTKETSPEPSVSAHLLQRQFTYDGWTCDHKATAKSGIPPRHVMQYFPEYVWIEGPHYRVMILPGKGEIKNAKGGESLPDDEDAPISDPVECPTWRAEKKIWTHSARDWSYGKHGIKKEIVSKTIEPPTHLAGPTESPRVITIEDLPPRHSGKSILPHATSAIWAVGRLVDDGPIVNMVRLSGDNWRAYWKDGGFSSAYINGRPATLNELRRLLKERK